MQTHILLVLTAIYEVGAIEGNGYLPHFIDQKTKSQGVKELAQGHPASKWLGWYFPRSNLTTEQQAQSENSNFVDIINAITFNNNICIH